MSETVQDACHDLNNALGAILVSAETGGKRAGGDAERAAFGVVAASARRAADLVARIPALASGAAGDAVAERDLAYLDGLHPPMSAVVSELEAHCMRDDIPLMDRAGVRLLATLVCAGRAERILELGTAYGYSALCMALAQGPSGRIRTVDPDVARTDIARSYFARAGVAGRIEIVNAPALEAIATLKNETYDLVFIDAVKTEYAAYLHAVLPHVKPAGIIVVDNLLWHHRSSAAPAPGDDESTRAIRAFNQVFVSHPSLRAVVLPVGDGVGLCVKIG
jgi:caffeoyl-CoA O-methyltransferase